MPEHPDERRLVELALGTKLTPPLAAAKAHSDGCAECARLVSRYRAVVEALGAQKAKQVLAPVA